MKIGSLLIKRVGLAGGSHPVKRYTLLVLLTTSSLLIPLEGPLGMDGAAQSDSTDRLPYLLPALDSNEVESLKRQAREAARAQSRASAVFQLRSIPSLPVSDKIELFTEQVYRETESDVLRQIISGLEELPEEVAVDPLLHLLNTSDVPDIRHRLVEALFRFRGLPKVKDTLNQLLASDPSPIVRQSVALWLGLIQQPHIFNSLTRAYVEESDPVVKAALIKGIALQHSPEADRFLTALAASDSDTTLQYLARQYLTFRQARSTTLTSRPTQSTELIVECEVSRALLRRAQQEKP